jgi:hypothetical protein
MASIPVLVLGYEFLQYAGIIRGTFSIPDLVIGLAGLALGIVVGNRNFNRNRYEKAIE